MEKILGWNFGIFVEGEKTFCSSSSQNLLKESVCKSKKKGSFFHPLKKVNGQERKEIRKDG